MRYLTSVAIVLLAFGGMALADDEAGSPANENAPTNKESIDVGGQT